MSKSNGFVSWVWPVLDIRVSRPFRLTAKRLLVEQPAWFHQCAIHVDSDSAVAVDSTGIFCLSENSI